MRTYFSLFIISLFTFCACSPISDDERLIYVEPVDANRAVLIEDFTGQDCSNCPNAAAEIQKIKEQYADGTVISVAIHGGPLARNSTARVVGLRSALGDAYVERWGVANTLPKGFVNRVGEPSNPDQWGTAVRDAVQERSQLQLDITTELDTLSRVLHIDVEALGLQFVEGKLQVWLTESGIVTLQAMPDGTRNGAYVHNHVLRAAVNGTWGEPFSIASGAFSTSSYDCTLDENWDARQIAAVAFVYNDSGVLQVVEKPIHY